MLLNTLPNSPHHRNHAAPKGEGAVVEKPWAEDRDTDTGTFSKDQFLKTSKSCYKIYVT